jgi:hypothetical protein
LFAVDNDETEIVACAEAAVVGSLPSDASLGKPRRTPK